MFWKMRYKQKEKNLSSTEITYFTGEYNTTDFYFSFNYMLTNHFALRNIIAINSGADDITKAHYGYLLTQDFSYTPTRLPLVVNIRYELFDATNYDTRFYIYEKDIPNVFSMPMLYSKGSRSVLNVHYNMNKHLSFWFKIVQTTYEDVSSIGSGLETINHNHKTDARTMIQWKF
jgi:hypothetical protein